MYLIHIGYSCWPLVALYSLTIYKSSTKRPSENIYTKTMQSQLNSSIKDKTMKIQRNEMRSLMKQVDSRKRHILFNVVSTTN